MDQDQFHLNSYQAALCFIPPAHLWSQIDALRSLYDPAHGKWPPHLNLFYPFVHPDRLPEACRRLAHHLAAAPPGPISMSLAKVGTFTSLNNDHVHTVFLTNSDPATVSGLLSLESRLVSAISPQLVAGSEKVHHLTIARAEHSDQDFKANVLRHKASLLPTVQWQADRLFILIRRNGAAVLSDSALSSEMVKWGYLDLCTGALVQFPEPERLYSASSAHPAVSAPESAPTFEISSEAVPRWVVSNLVLPDPPPVSPNRLVVASYNVMADFSLPRDHSRETLLVESVLLHSQARADVLVLQEVTDHFLSTLLAHPDISAAYPYSTHGRPDQPDIGPLPHYLNVVISKYPFSWLMLPFERRHKGSPVLVFPTIRSAPASPPMVLAACHLTPGLSDGAVAAKTRQLHSILDYLSRNHPDNCCVVAGDFNIPTSRLTIDEGLRNTVISPRTHTALSSLLDNTITEAGFGDAWLMARCSVGESSSTAIAAAVTASADPRRSRSAAAALSDGIEGEQGATFDPLENHLAATAVGQGICCRPQRYDRILVRGLTVRGFNLFGFPNGPAGPIPSDHWGVRCLLETATVDQTDQVKAGLRLVPITPVRAPPHLSGTASLTAAVSRACGMPTQSDSTVRDAAVELLRHVLLPPPEGSRLVIVPVGSFGLGLWTSASDIDCLCIGTLGPTTFSAIAVASIKRAHAAGRAIRLRRRVRALTGILLELEVEGVKMDLQYCAAAAIVDSWPDCMKRPSSDPIFDLPALTLIKLKAARDMFYLQRSIPDLAQFRIAFLFIKAWAKERGLYAAKFGYLGGIHLCVMLARVCKALALHGGGGVFSPADVVATFFHHYATFDWESDVVFDQYYYQTSSLRYNRTAREPLCILGWHGPALNVALNASVPVVRTLAEELIRARDALASAPDLPGLSWDEFLGPGRDGHPQSGGAALQFVSSFKSYIRIDVYYWCRSAQKRLDFVGWLESRCVTILIEIQRKVPELFARFWPGRFSQHAPTDQNGEEQQDIWTCYLIGLRWAHQNESKKSSEEEKAAQSTLLGILRWFEDRVRTDDKYYDADQCLVQASWTPAAGLGAVFPDQRELEDRDAGDDDDAGDDEETESNGGDEDDNGCADEAMAGTSSTLVPTHRKAAVEGGAKLRSAADVLSRLRWDSGLDSADYLVGYEDRFLGTRERPVDLWRSDQTDDEFIPQHRIVYFKRCSDAVVVWDRRRRTDALFKSGNSSAERD